ncbi:uncharacterized protein KGF55_004122 [Candida pseudojiufengensis]|uniref:uncharacterized protein n=1 Tax=Candida pseudojiufengensis TaxID=497109 RepID=UPI0022250313|nr:uncharacterized protein KGF55_004122 [Candida pseudojiufengensis]KAI5961197.1 hypothetical protein KGF55_004122 [Candida pseudojiufengensis]
MTDISENFDNLQHSNNLMEMKKENKKQPFPNLEQRKGGVIHIKNNAQKNGSVTNTASARKRSNSQSQVVNLPIKPKTSRDISNSYNYNNFTNSYPRKRNQIQYYVTLLPLNDTFVKKHLPVSIFPETTKLGRPTGTKHKPDFTNGYFDSRVLSRNHAQIYVDSNNGKLMLQDLGSSNGTYLNDTRLSNEPTEVKIGDVVCLGFNVQAESTHKQISLKIENVDIVANTKFDTSALNKNQFDTPQFKHLSFVEEIYRKINTEDKEAQKSSTSFDTAMFGDVNPILDDELLGLFLNNTGIYNNSQITNTSTFEKVINTLLDTLSKVKQQSSAINSLQNFITNYEQEKDELNKKYIEEEFSQRSEILREELKQEQLKSKSLEGKLNKFKTDKEAEIEELNNKLKTVENEKSSMFTSIKDLQEKINFNERKYKTLTEQLEELRQPKITKEASTSTSGDFSNEEHDLVSDAINGFIMDLSRTPSVRDNMKGLESASINKSTTLKDAIELTPPSSDNEEEENEPDENNVEADEINHQNGNQSRKSSKDLYRENLSSSSIIATNLMLNDVEPFPKVEDSPSVSSTSSNISLSERSIPGSSNLTQHNKFVSMKLSDQDKQRFSTFAIAMSFLLLGYYLQRLVN